MPRGKNQEPEEERAKKPRCQEPKKFQIKNIKAPVLLEPLRFNFFEILSLILGILLYSFFGSWHLRFLVLFPKTKSPGEPGDLLCGWVSKYRETYFPSQY